MSNEVQMTKFDICHLNFGFHLAFGLWILDFCFLDNNLN